MKLTVNFTSQGRLLEGHLYIPDTAQGEMPALIFEGAMTGATSQVTEYLAREVSAEGFVCFVLDHNYFGEEESGVQPWESPSKRIHDIRAALQMLVKHASVDANKIVGVGVSVGAEYLAQVCQTNGTCKGLILVQGPFDDAQNTIQNVDIPKVIIDETHLDSAVDEIVIWCRTLFNGGYAGMSKIDSYDWSLGDK